MAHKAGVAFLAAVAALGGCGGDNDAVKTVTQTVAAPTTTAPASSAEPHESAGAFTKRNLEYQIKGQYGRSWDELHPAHQKLVTRSQYDTCSRRPEDELFAGNESVVVKETYDDPIDIPEIPEKTSKAITAELREPSEGGSASKATFTLHAVNVDGSWRWILSDRLASALRRGECDDGSKLPVATGGAAPPASSVSPIRFAGSGTRQLRPVTISRDATLRWTHDGEYSFDLDDEDFEVNVSSDAPSGETYVSAGTYQFDVSADGNWTIVIR